MIETLKKLLPRNQFARSVSVLAGGTAAGQLIVVAASPILTRLYTPGDFGLLAVYAGILGISGVIASLRYQLAIPLPERNSEAASIAILSLSTVLVTTLCLTIAVWLLGDQVVYLLQSPNLAPYLWLIPLGFFLVGVYQVFEYWAIRTKEFSGIARARLSQSVCMVATQIAGYTFGPVALLLGRVFGQSAGVWGLARSALAKNSVDFRDTSGEEIRDTAVRYRKFPLVSTWTGLASSAGLNLPPLLIASFLGVTSAGLFALAHRVLSQPMTVIGKAVSDAFYQKAAEAHRKGDLGKTVSGVFSILVTLALAPAITIFITIPEIFVFIFGKDWAMAGEIARWMTPWLFFQFVVSPCTGIYPIIDRHDVALTFQLSLLVSSVMGAVIGGIYLDSLIWVVALISLLSSTVYLWRVMTTFKIVGLRPFDAFYSIIRSAAVSLCINTPLIALNILFSESLISQMLGASVSAALWFIFLVRPMIRSLA